MVNTVEGQIPFFRCLSVRIIFLFVFWFVFFCVGV